MRLRRTIVVGLALVLVMAGGIRVLTRDTAEQTAQSLRAAPGPSGRTAPPTTSRPQDGSTGSETRRPATAVPQHGTGRISVIAVPAAEVAKRGRTVTYTVELEGGLAVDPDEVAGTVQSVLLDPRGWQTVEGVRFVNVSPAQEALGAQVDIRVTLASPGLTDELCAPMQTLSEVSCWNGTRSVLNYRRWALGDDSYGDDIARYRVYQVNHEVGHGLGHQHQQCPGPGKRAPVMLQQTLGLGGCTPWPYPSGA